MKVLINVATKEKGIILYDESQVVSVKCWTESGAELKWVLPSLHALFQENNIEVEDDIEKIVLVVGPGSFTGIRIAVSIVNTLKYLYPNIALSALSTGELFAALDNEQHGTYLFQVFASDVFEFEREGTFMGRKDMDALDTDIIQQSTGMLMEQVMEKFPKFKTVSDTSSWKFDDIMRIEKKAHILDGLAEPFYGKGANITMPRSS